MPRPCAPYHALSPETCDLCRKVVSSPRHRKAWGEADPGPSLWARLATFTHAQMRHTLEGRPQAAREQYDRRVSICEACPELVMPDKVCRVCGCFVERKAWHAGAVCPLGKWADAPSFYFLPNQVDPLCDPIDPNPPQGWAQHDQVRDLHVHALNLLLTRDLGAPPIAQGDGCVIVGAGKYWPMAFAAARQVRRYAPNLPIEIWHRGSTEPVYTPDLAHVENCVAVDWERRDLGYIPRARGGWEQKLIALTGTHFKRVLYLDADAYPVAEFTDLFDVMDQSGFAYWTDLEGMENKYKPAAWGLPETQVPRVQGGQLFLNREKCWRMLCICHWACQHSDYYFSAGGYGDQDCWRGAMQATGFTPIILGQCQLSPPGLTCLHKGQPVIFHRPSGKLWAPWYNDPPKFWAHLRDEALVKESYYIAVGNTPSERFERLYALGGWGEVGASAGSGRDKDESAWINLANALIDLSGAREVVDLGAGDMQVTIQLQCHHRIAVDTVIGPHDLPGGSGIWTTYVQADLLDHQLPAGDLALCRDVLHHWPTADVADFLRWAEAYGPWRHLVLCFDTTTEPGPRRCEFGGWAPLPLDLAAYGAPALQLVTMLGQKAVCLLRCAKG